MSGGGMQVQPCSPRHALVVQSVSEGLKHQHKPMCMCSDQ
jgi:hypothetical protein